MKKIRELKKAFTVHAIIFSLLQTFFIFSPQQGFAETKSTGGVSGNDILIIAQQALSGYGQYSAQRQNMIMAQIQSTKNTQLMQSLSPNCRKADGTSCYTAPGKYFPECPLPATISAMPHNVCSETMSDPAQSSAQISSMITYESIAEGWINYYTQMQNEATNMSVPFGLACLQQKKKALDSQLIEMGNNLTRLQDQLIKDKDAFRANTKALLEQMAETNDELLGASGTGKNNLNLKTKDFSKYFSKSCQSVIGEEGMANAPTAGLLGVMQSLSPINKRAADHNDNRNIIESEVRSDIQKIQKSIKDGGLQDYFAGKITETSKFKSLVTATQKQSSEFKIAQERISKELAKLHYEIPAMDKNFAVDFDEFLKGSKTFFKKQYVNDCVTGADKSGIAISTDDILNSLQQKSTNSAGTARDKYKAALKTILSSDAFIDDKLAQIKALESTYQDITITYQNADAQRVTETPYDLYITTLKKCEERYKQDDQFSANGSNGVSQKKKVERGQSLLRELKKLHDNYASELGSRVLEQVLSCNGESKKSGASCGDKESFDHTSATFCLAQANQCANEVNDCFAQATKHVETRKANMEILAKGYNQSVAIMVKRSNQLYDAQKAAVMNMVKTIQARFPGTNFAIPENMIISMPEMKKDAFGVDLANDGNLAFMDELPKKIDLLKKIFKDQQAKVDDEIDDYISKQANAMSTQQDRWKALAQQCKGMIASVSKDLAKYNSEGQKAQAAQDAAAGSFCRKYASLRENPIGACNDAQKLAEEADQIAARLTNQALHYTANFRSVCNMYNNEDAEDDMPPYCDTDEEEKNKPKKRTCDAHRNRQAKRMEAANKSVAKGKTKKISFSSLCGDGEDDLNDDDAFIKAAAKKLSESDQEALRGVETLKDVKKKSEDLSEEALSFFNNMNRLSSKSSQKDGSLCKKLSAINNLESEFVGSKEDITKLADAKIEEIKKQKPTAAATSTTTPPDPKAPAAAPAVATQPDNTERDIEAIKNQKANALAKLELNETVANLVPPLENEDLMEAQFNRLGQQVDESCDAQASNNNIIKNGSSSLMQAYEAMKATKR